MIDLLKTQLSAFVPPLIMELQRQGGPTDWHFDQARAFSSTLAYQGDVLLFGGKPGEAAALMGQLTEALAVMAFVPGGISAFGLHFEATPESETAV